MDGVDNTKSIINPTEEVIEEILEEEGYILGPHCDWIKTPTSPNVGNSNGAAVRSKNNELFSIGKHHEQITIQKYDMHNDKWVLLMEFHETELSIEADRHNPEWPRVFFIKTAVMDSGNNIIFHAYSLIADDLYTPCASKFISIDIKTKKHKIIRAFYYPYGADMDSKILKAKIILDMFYINGKIHWFQEERRFYPIENRKNIYVHCSLCPQTGDLQKLGEVERAKFIYMPRKKIILKIDDKCIFEYSPLNEQWKKWDIEIPKHLESSQAFVTRNDQYVIFFGGLSFQPYCFFDDIFFYDFQTKCLQMSEVKLPKKGPFSGRIFNNNMHDELLVLGFFRKYGNYIHTSSSDVIKFVATYVCFEYIHVTTYDLGLPPKPLKDASTYWTISIDKIVTPVIKK